MKIINVTNVKSGKKIKTVFVDNHCLSIDHWIEVTRCSDRNWFVLDYPLFTTSFSEVQIFLNSPQHNDNLNLWNFDRQYHLMIYLLGKHDECTGTLGIFRLVNDAKEKFLHLYNFDYGYQGSGFCFPIDSTSIRLDKLIIEKENYDE